jgi:hypothetical protein
VPPYPTEPIRFAECGNHLDGKEVCTNTFVIEVSTGRDETV